MVKINIVSLWIHSVSSEGQLLGPVFSVGGPWGPSCRGNTQVCHAGCVPSTPGWLKLGDYSPPSKASTLSLFLLPSPEAKYWLVG